jgi:hypothetical protein
MKIFVYLIYTVTQGSKLEMFEIFTYTRLNLSKLKTISLKNSINAIYNLNLSHIQVNYRSIMKKGAAPISKKSV